MDAYIVKSPDFAKPILTLLRRLAHSACPEVEETLKWGMPHFLHKGILFGMAGFKQHCMLHFWKGDLVLGENFKATNRGMNQFGRITALSDLPDEQVLCRYIQRAVELNEAGVKKTPREPKPKKKLVLPKSFLAALNKDKKARTKFENFSYSHQKEYVEWIADAKREEPRARRIAIALEWLAQGKSRNWKYASC